MLGNFTDGSKIIPPIAEQLEKFEDKLDTQYILIFYYKFACMHFGNSNFQQSVFWCNKILPLTSLRLRLV